MKNPLKTLTDKAKALIAKLKTPEVQAKIMQRGGFGLLGGAAIGFGVLIFAPALAVPAGCATLGLMGVGFGLLQESDNKKHVIWMKENVKTAVPAPVPAPVVIPPAPVASAPVVEVKSPVVEFAKAAEKTETPVIAVPAAAPETPKPPVNPQP